MKNTKRALLTSVIALVMCITMLVGTTFAWFTDSVVSANNKIVAGELDVELYMHTETGKVRISDTFSPIFGDEDSLIAQNVNADTLWEPGKTQVAYLEIANEGNLALKYKVAIEVRNDANDLYEVMEYAIIPDAKVTDAKIDRWANLADEDTKPVVVGTNVDTTDVPLGKDESHFFALAIHMLEEAGNKYQNGEVSFDIKVLATQDDVEADYYDNTYDENATYPGDATTQAVRNALAKEIATAEDGATIYLEDIAYGSISLGSASYTYTDYPADITLVGSNSTSMNLVISSGMDISGWTFKNITFTGSNGLTFANGAKAADITVDNCKFLTGNFSAMKDQGGTMTDLTIVNSEFFSKETAILVQNATDVTVDNCFFNSIGHNAVQITQAKGTINITNNSVDGTTDRAFRIANTSATAVNVTGNTVVDAGDADNELMKISGYNDSCVVTLDGNTWNGMTDEEIATTVEGTNWILK